MIEQTELDKLAPALAKAQGELKAAAKDSVNPHFKSKYADLASIWDACRQPLTSNGLSVIQMPLTDTGEVRVVTMLLHESGQYLRSTVAASPRDMSPQSVGSCITYLKRYGLAAMVGVVADEDDDGQAAQPQGRQQQRPAQRQQPAPEPAPSISETDREIQAAARKLGVKSLADFKSKVETIVGAALTLGEMSDEQKNTVLSRLVDEVAAMEA